MRKLSRTLAVAAALLAAGCAGQAGTDDQTSATTSAYTGPGRDTWFNATFGGEKFFSLILPNAPFNLPLAFDKVLLSDRNTRFEQWGVINQPGCAQPGGPGTPDVCPDDPGSTGIVGIRRFPDPTGQRPFIVGVSCAGCHAGLDPSQPPGNPDHPAWVNIHPTTGNQFLQIGKIFGANLNPHDPRYQVFQSWAPGTVDTTAIESDHINNPGIVTQFYNLPQRPFFDLTSNGQPIHVHRAGQGGEDDAGCEAAAIRVYFNIGMCAAECMIPHLANGPGGTQTPIDLDQCRQVCPDLVNAEASVGEMCNFMASNGAPSLAATPGGQSLIINDQWVLARGAQVFRQNCASCHGGAVLSDDLIHPAGDIGTNSCRSKTTNWMAGHIWAAFSSDQYKQRPTGGPGYYRDVPLLAAWATAPFFHNNRLGVQSSDPTVQGRVAAYEEAMYELLNPWVRDYAGSVQRTSADIQVPTPLGPVTLPAGTPVAAFASLDPTNPLNTLCPDFVENEGHYFGAFLSPSDKFALTEYLKTK